MKRFFCICFSLLIAFLLFSPQAIAASASRPDGFRTSADCYGGFVSYNGKSIFSERFPGKYCGECCGGVDATANIQDFPALDVRCVQWGKIGRNDDINTAHWFEKAGRRAGWAYFGRSSLCFTSQMPN